MKRVMLALILSLASFGAMASCEISNTGLPDSVLQKLKTDCETARLAETQKKEEEKNSPIPSVPFINPERMTGWAAVAEGFANAMGAAAKQLNISVNEFITTPAGMITIGVILWKVIGTSILKLLAMYGVFLVARQIIRVMWTKSTITVERKFWQWTWTKENRVYYTWKDADDTQCGMGFLVLAAAGVAETILLAALVL